MPSAHAHPARGGRFTLVRRADGESLAYDLEVLCAGGSVIAGRVFWSDGGPRLDLDGSEATSAVDLEWVHETVLGFARVLAREPKRRLVRWRTPR